MVVVEGWEAGEGCRGSRERSCSGLFHLFNLPIRPPHKPDGFGRTTAMSMQAAQSSSPDHTCQAGPALLQQYVARPQGA